MIQMAVNPANIGPITIIPGKTNEPVLLCKCGNEPYVGAEFYYKSKYSIEPTIGIIAIVNDSSITSTNGTPYHKSEIEVKPKHIAREEKLNDLGII